MIYIITLCNDNYITIENYEFIYDITGYKYFAVIGEDLDNIKYIKGVLKL